MPLSRLCRGYCTQRNCSGPCRAPNDQQRGRVPEPARARTGVLQRDRGRSAGRVCALPVATVLPCARPMRFPPAAAPLASLRSVLFGGAVRTPNANALRAGRLPRVSVGSGYGVARAHGPRSVAAGDTVLRAPLLPNACACVGATRKTRPSRVHRRTPSQLHHHHPRTGGYKKTDPLATTAATSPRNVARPALRTHYGLD